MNTRDIIGEFLNAFQLILNTHLPEANRDIIDDIKADVDESLTEILDKYDIDDIAKDKVVMKSKSYNYNMASWGLEKSENVLKELVRISEMLVNKELNFETCDNMIDYPETAQERFEGSLVIALYDLLKIYSFFIDEDWNSEYASWILNEGEEGYEKVLVSMNQLEKTTKDIKKSALTELYNSLILENINRNTIHDLLWQCRKKQVTISKDVERIQEEVERWTMGEITEEEFKENIKTNINNLQIYLKDF